ncbi:hypothetical protein M440DRAFT_1079541 [Trichoderma longibrachiatum ATCC 18648]|uniref:Uncharacterized protein n=1 Tax=Trichoderma longibrachiatum ATCC 18648 TaxID=983965 RepID=A0A2T4BTN2_TRILO|nr:hypothetical protein M440DRAFT_1079541 [Trichoderma longibrachiatum ATCC 18648]
MCLTDGRPTLRPRKRPSFYKQRRLPFETIFLLHPSLAFYFPSSLFLFVRLCRLPTYYLIQLLWTFSVHISIAAMTDATRF